MTWDLYTQFEGWVRNVEWLDEDLRTAICVVKLLHQSKEINSELTRAIEAIANLASIIEDRENRISELNEKDSN